MFRHNLGGMLLVVSLIQAACVGSSPSIGAHESGLCVVPQGPTPEAGDCAQYPRRCTSHFSEDLGWHEVCEPDPAHCWGQFSEERGWFTVCDADGEPATSGDDCTEIYIGTYEAYPQDCSNLPTLHSTCGDDGRCYSLDSRCYDVPGQPYDRYVTDWFQRTCN